VSQARKEEGEAQDDLRSGDGCARGTPEKR